MPTLPNLNSIQKRLVPLMWVLGPMLVVGVIALWLLTSAQRHTPRVTRPAPESIAPGETLRIGMSGSNLDQCSVDVDGLPQEEVMLEVASGALVIQPATVWPDGQQITLNISCNKKIVHTQTLSVRGATELTIEEQGAAQARLDAENARQRQEYLETNPFVDAYPIRTEAFVARYLEADQVIYVLPLQPIDNRDTLRETVRQAANAVGTPTEIPIVFSDEYNESSTP